LRYAASIGCDSADGTYLAFGPERNLSRLLGLAVRRQRRPEAAERSGQVGRDARLFSQQLSLREREFDVISNSEPTIPNVPTSSKQSTTESPTAAWTADRIRALGTVTTVPIAARSPPRSSACPGRSPTSSSTPTGSRSRYCGSAAGTGYRSARSSPPCTCPPTPNLPDRLDKRHEPRVDRPHAIRGSPWLHPCTTR
jgi:hypothetical protein